MENDGLDQLSRSFIYHLHHLFLGPVVHPSDKVQTRVVRPRITCVEIHEEFDHCIHCCICSNSRVILKVKTLADHQSILSESGEVTELATLF